jgi:hypothetical protein
MISPGVLDRRPAVLVAVGVALLLVPSLVSAVTAPDLEGAANNTVDAGDVVVSYEGRPDGRISWYDDNFSEEWTHDAARSYLANQVVANETVFFTWKRVQRSQCGRFDPPCAHTGFTVYDRGTDEVVRNWSYPVRYGGNSEVHDAEVLDDGRVIVADMEYERIFILNEDNEMTWQWNASSFYEKPPDVTSRDWLHINDVDRIGPGRFMISVRNSNQILIIQRGEGVVEVINGELEGHDDPCMANNALYDGDGDGDVVCGDPSIMAGQHNPHWLGNSTVLVADSLNNRIVELEKQDNGTWIPTWSVSEIDGVRLDWPRDADRLPNGNTVITDSLNDRVVTVASNGSVVWSMNTPGLPYEADLLPHGEPRTNISAANETTRATDGSFLGKIPLVYRARNGLVHVLPIIPYWFSDLHLVGAALGLLLILGGGGLAAKQRFFDGETDAAGLDRL